MDKTAQLAGIRNHELTHFYTEDQSFESSSGRVKIQINF